MKHSLFIISLVYITTSCSEWKRHKTTSCVAISKIPSSIIRQDIVANQDSVTTMVIQLFCNQENSSLEFTKYRIINQRNTSYQGIFNQNGCLELEIEAGIYSIELKNPDHPEFTMDSIEFLPSTKTLLDIKLGKPSGFMTVQSK